MPPSLHKNSLFPFLCQFPCVTSASNNHIPKASSVVSLQNMSNTSFRLESFWLWSPFYDKMQHLEDSGYLSLPSLVSISVTLLPFITGRNIASNWVLIPNPGFICVIEPSGPSTRLSPSSKLHAPLIVYFIVISFLPCSSSHTKWTLATS